MESAQTQKVVLFIVTFTTFMFSLLLAYSPLLCYYIPLIMLALLKSDSRSLRAFLVLFSIAGGAFFVGSRNIFDAPASDYDVYYGVYQIVLNGGSLIYPDFSSGIEIFLPAFFKLLSLIIGDAKPEFILAITVMSQLTLVYIWLEWDGLKHLAEKDKNLCIASTLGLLFIYMFSQILRQGFSTIFCLFALSFFCRGNKKGFLLFFLLACISHLSALIVIPMFIVFMRHKALSILLVCCTIFFSFVFSLLLPMIISHNLLGAASYKLGFYTITDMSGFDFTSYFKFWVITVLSGFFFFLEGKEYLKRIILFGGLVYIALLPIPLASDRALMLLAALLPGYMLFFSLYKIRGLYKIVLSLYFILKIMMLGPLYKHTGGNNDPMEYWYLYDWADDSAFYYIK